MAEGGYNEMAYTPIDGVRQKVELTALSAAGLNEPRVLEGRLPRDVREIAVTQKYLDASGKELGDTVTFEGTALSAAGLNEPRVLEGRLPRDVREIAVTQKYLDASGKELGDTVTFEGTSKGPTSASGDTATKDDGSQAL